VLLISRFSFVFTIIPVLVVVLLLVLEHLAVFSRDAESSTTTRTRTIKEWRPR